DAEDRELDHQDVAFLARREVSGRAMHRSDGGIGKGPRVELRGFLGVAVVPEADRVLCWIRHVTSPCACPEGSMPGSRTKRPRFDKGSSGAQAGGLVRPEPLDD